MDLQFTTAGDSDDDNFDDLYLPAKDFQERTRSARERAGRILQLLSNAQPSEPSIGESQPESSTYTESDQSAFELSQRQQLQLQKQHTSLSKRNREEEFQREYEKLQKKPAQLPTFTQKYSFRRRRDTRHRSMQDFNDTLSMISYNSDTNFSEFSTQRTQRDFADSNLLVASQETAIQNDDNNDGNDGNDRTGWMPSRLDLELAPTSITKETTFPVSATHIATSNIVAPATGATSARYERMDQHEVPGAGPSKVVDKRPLLTSQEPLAFQESPMHAEQKKDTRGNVDIKGKGRMGHYPQPTSPEQLKQHFAPSTQPEGSSAARTKLSQQQQQPSASPPRGNNDQEQQQQFMDQDIDDIDYDYGDDDDDDFQMADNESTRSKRRSSGLVMEQNQDSLPSTGQAAEDNLPEPIADFDALQEEIPGMGGHGTKNGNNRQAAGLVSNRKTPQDSISRKAPTEFDGGSNVDDNDVEMADLVNLEAMRQNITRVISGNTFASQKLEKVKNHFAGNESTYHETYYSGAAIPKADARALFTKFSGSPLPYLVTSKLQALSEVFFEQIADDLTSYAEHAQKYSIGVEDMRLLMQRQGFVNENTSMEALAHRYLSREEFDEVCVSSLAYNELYPAKRR